MIAGNWNERSGVHYARDSKESHNGAPIVRAVRADIYGAILLREFLRSARVRRVRVLSWPIVTAND